ncbi:MAG: hypothetical protein CSA45_01630, partial [Gammaproteobacteria bacterium]
GGVTEGETGTFPVELRDSDGNLVTAVTDVTVDVAYTGTAADGTDFTGIAQVTIPAGSSSVDLDLVTLDDNLAEGTETVNITISNPVGGGFEAIGVGVDTADMDIVDETNPADVDNVYVRLVNDDVVTEGEGDEQLNHRLEFVDANGDPIVLASGQQVTVTLAYSAAETTSDADFTNTRETSITIMGNGSDHYDITNAVLDDNLKEGTESYTLTLTGTTNITAGGNDVYEAVAVDVANDEVTGTIKDNFSPVDDTGTVIEDHVATAAGNVLANDEVATGVAVSLSDSPADVADWGTLVLQADGNYTYTLDDSKPKVQELAVGETVTQEFKYIVDGDTGTKGALIITIQGTNDRPEITSDNVTLAITEQTDTTAIAESGDMAVEDVDLTDVVTAHYDKDDVTFAFGGGNTSVTSLTAAQQAMLKDAFDVTSSQGLSATQTENTQGIKWNFNAESTELDFIPAGETITITYPVYVTDDNAIGTAFNGNEISRSETKLVTVTITGTDDLGEIADVSVRFEEDDIQNVTSSNFNLFDSGLVEQDPDQGETVSLSKIEVDVDGDGTAETFTFTPGTPQEIVFVSGSGTGTGGEYAKVVIDNDGMATVTATENFSGSLPEMQYWAKSGSVELDPKAISISVTPESDAPTVTVDDTKVDIFEDGNELNNDLDTTNDANFANSTVALGFGAPQVTDVIDQNGALADDYPERLGVITLSGFNQGSGLYKADGTQVLDATTAANNSVKIRLTDSGNHITDMDTTGVIDMTVAEFEGLVYKPAPQSHVNAEITLSVTEYEVDASGNKLPDADVVGTNGSTSTISVEIDVKAVTDGKDLAWNDAGTPDGVEEWTVNGSNVTARIKEDTTLDLTAQLVETMGEDLDGSENIWYTVDGLPDGTMVVFNGTSYTASGGSITTDPVALTDGPNSTVNPGFTFTPPKDFAGKMDGVSITLHAKDSDADSAAHNANGIAEISKTVTLALDVTPTIDVTAQPVTGQEDHYIDLFNLAITDVNQDNGSTNDTPETYRNIGISKLEIDNAVANGVNFYTYIVNPDGTKIYMPIDPKADPGTITTDDGISHDVYLFDVTRFNDLDSPTGTASGNYAILPPAHSSTDIPLTYVVETTDSSLNPAGDSSAAAFVSKITVTPVAERVWQDENGDGIDDVPNVISDSNVDTVADVTMTGNHVYSGEIFEDGLGGGNGNAPTWFSLADDNAGGHLKDGWTNQDDTFEPGQQSHTTDYTDSEQTYALLTFGRYHDGDDRFTAMDTAQFRYTDAAGQHILVDDGNGVEIPVAYLNTVEFIPPNDISHYNLEAGEHYRIKVEARTKDYDEDGSGINIATSGLSWLTFDSDIVGVPDPTTLVVKPALGFEDAGRTHGNDSNVLSTASVVDNPAGGIKLDITPKSKDNDGSETFQIKITSIPEGVELYYDTNGDGVVDKLSITGGEVVISDFDADAPFYLVPPHNFSGSMELGVQSRATEDGNTGQWEPSNAVGPVKLPVFVFNVADEVVNNELNQVDVDGRPYNATYTEADLDANGNEIALKDIYQCFNDGDTTNDIDSYDNTVPVADGNNDKPEEVSLILSGLPEGFNVVGASFVGGSGVTRQWSVTEAKLADGTVKIVTPPNFAGEIPLTVNEITTETSGNFASKTASVRNAKIFVSPDAADDGIVDANTTIAEDGEVALDFNTFISGPDTNDATQITGYEQINTVTVTQAELTRLGLTLSVDGVEQSGAADATYTFDADQTVVIKMNGSTAVPEHSDGEFDLAFSYTIDDVVKDAGGNVLATATSVPKPGSYHVDILPITDAPEITNEDTLDDPAEMYYSTIPGDPRPNDTEFTKTVHLTSPDKDGSEHMTRLVIKGVPDGVDVVGGVPEEAGTITDIVSGAEIKVNNWLVNLDSTLPISGTDASYDVVFKARTGSLPPMQVGTPITIEAYNQDFGADGNYQDAAELFDSVSFDFNMIRHDTEGDNEEIIEENSFNVYDVVDDSITEGGHFSLNDVVDVTMNPEHNSGANFGVILDDLPPGTEVTSTNPAVQITQVDGRIFVTFNNLNTDQELQDMLDSVIITPEENFSTNNATAGDPDGPFGFDVSIAAWDNVRTEYYPGPGVDAHVDVNITPVTDEMPAPEVQNITLLEDTLQEVTLELGNPVDGDYHRIVDGKVYFLLEENYVSGDDTASGGNTEDTGHLYSGVDASGNPTGELVSATPPAGTNWPAGNYYVMDLPAGTTDYSDVKVYYQPAANNDGTATIKTFVQNQEVHDDPTKNGEVSSSGSDGEETINLTIQPQDDAAVLSATNTPSADEGGFVELTYDLASGDSSDVAPPLSSLIVTVPDDPAINATVFYADTNGDLHLASKFDDGKWNIPIDAANDHPQVFVVADPDWSGVIEADVQAVTQDGLISNVAGTAHYDAMINPKADTIDAEPTQTFGKVNRWTELNLNANKDDRTDGSERTDLVISDASGAALAAGMGFRVDGVDLSASQVIFDSATGVYTITGLTGDQINNLGIRYGQPFDGNLKIVATVTDTAIDPNGTTVTDVASVDIIAPLLIENAAEINLTPNDDTEDYSGVSDHLIVHALAGDDTVTGGDGNDRIYGEGGDDELHGGAGNDLLRGAWGTDSLYGDDGNDELHGGADNDILDGGAGADVLYGETGDDILVFDVDDSNINGGAGTDTLKLTTNMDLDTMQSNRFDQLEIIDMTGNGNQSITHLETSDLLEIINDTPAEMQNKGLTINGDSGDSVELTGGNWGTANTTANPGYTTYTYSDGDGNHDLLIQDGINIII